MHQLLWLPVIIIPHLFPFLIELAYYVLFIDSLSFSSAEPIIEAALSKASEEIVFVLAICGDKPV